tara:strand:+ start:12170 stop:13423 length:1254 start_codon:yes stop_codon:yes gene_type:complete
MEQNIISGNVIDVLGGGRKLAKLLKSNTGIVLNEKTVYSWKQQGVPDKWKPVLVKLLVKNGFEVPKSFLLPGMDIANFQKTNSKNIESLYSTKDSNLEEISPLLLKEFYYEMLLLRRFEEKVGQMYGLGLIGGFCHLYIGQEAVSVGMEKAIKKQDAVITGYRCHAHLISRGTDPYVIFSELLGKNDGISSGKGGSMHMFDPKNNFWGGHGIVGAQVPIGIGLAFSLKYKNTNNLSVTYFGDGAANQGQVYESYNMASLWKLPVIFCIENNQYGMGTSIKKASAGNDLSKHGESFDIPGIAVDGMNPVSVYLAAKKAANWVRSGNGPIILEMKTYRYRGHSMSDPAKYRTREEVQRMRDEKDPIESIRNKLLNENIYNEEEVNKIDKTIRQEISDKADKAINADVSNLDNIHTHVLL